jgi:hypothetical protein
MAMCALIFPFTIPLEILYSIAGYFSTDDSDYYWLSIIPGLLLFPIYQGALILYIASAISGDYLSRNQYYQISLRLWPPLIVLYFVTTIAVLGGLMLFVFPALIVMARIAFSEFYCILFKQKPMDAFSESWEQTKEHQWLLIAGIAVIFLVTAIPVWVVEEVIDSLDAWNPAITFVSGVVTSVLTIPFTIFGFRVFTMHQERLNQQG